MGASAQSLRAGRGESPAGDILLCAKNIKKVYGGAVALADGNLTVRSGEIHALLGENGAGKSTLIKCLAGTPPPDAGEIQVGRVTLPISHSARHATEAGLAFIHQETTLIETLSVDENIALANGYKRRGGLIDWRQVRRSAEAAMGKMGVYVDPSRLVAELPTATRTVLAIAAALARSARILVLDEPTATLGANDVQVLFGVLRRISEAGNAVVFVSHRLDEVYELCDQITVLRDGVTVGAVKSNDISKDDLVALICGHHVAISQKQKAPAVTAPVLTVTNLRGPLAGPVSFTVRSGEILGLTGLSDAGHYEVGEILFGLKRARSGSVTLRDRPFAPNSPIEAMRRGVGYVPPDRNVLGLARDMDSYRKTYSSIRAAVHLPSAVWGRSLMRASVPMPAEFCAVLESVLPSRKNQSRQLERRKRAKSARGAMVVRRRTSVDRKRRQRRCRCWLSRGDLRSHSPRGFTRRSSVSHHFGFRGDRGALLAGFRLRPRRLQGRAQRCRGECAHHGSVPRQPNSINRNEQRAARRLLLLLLLLLLLVAVATVLLIRRPARMLLL